MLFTCQQDRQAALDGFFMLFVLRNDGSATAPHYMDVMGRTELLAQLVLFSGGSTSASWRYKVLTVYGRGCGWYSYVSGYRWARVCVET